MPGDKSAVNCEKKDFLSQSSLSENFPHFSGRSTFEQDDLYSDKWISINYGQVKCCIILNKTR